MFKLVYILLIYNVRDNFGERASWHPMETAHPSYISITLRLKYVNIAEGWIYSLVVINIKTGQQENTSPRLCAKTSKHYGYIMINSL
jgi:hypothetical protein